MTAPTPPTPPATPQPAATPRNLAQAMPHYPLGYLLTVSDATTPHAVEVHAGLSAGRVEVTGHGRTSTANADKRESVTLLWPATSPGGYALIVDGRAVATPERLLVTVTRAILHRSVEAGEGSDRKCVANCVELEF